VIDLDYSEAALWDYQIETLKFWARLVDGFRCDVASLIPLDFWLRSRDEVAQVNPDCLWLSETVDPSFISQLRSLGLSCLSDSEIFQAFDISYDYDIYQWYKGYLEGRNSLCEYAEKINNQETIYPANYVKLRCLENHDQCRVKFLVPDEKALLNWTAFLYFQKGMTMIYAGQETGNEHRPSLFEKETVDWHTGCDLSKFMAALYRIKKNSGFANSQYRITALPGDILLAVHKGQDRGIYGVFSMKGLSSPVPVDLEGTFTNLIDGAVFRIEENRLSCRGDPVIFEFPVGR
jgi:glycosidase